MPRPTRSQLLAFQNLRKIDSNAEVSWDKKVGAAIRLRATLSGPQAGAPETIARQFVTAHKALFAMKEPEEELALKDVSTDRRGNRHLRFQQMYQGLPVFGSELIVHMDQENTVRGTTGKFI